MNYRDKYEMTIGIECHVQLATHTKLFSPADNDAREKEPNTATHELDFALPGMLPRLNKKAVELAIKAGKALNAQVANVSRFDRKHYFYPDLPKGYQITQMYQPIILSGYVDAPLEDGSMVHVRIHHAHLEEDAGKLSHYSDYSLVDLNRAGTPLIEIVSEPDMHSPAEAKAYASELYKLMTYSGVTRGDLYHGNMRFDVNISLAPIGSKELGTRAEVKNLNSFRSVERAAEYEFNRQAELLDRGEQIVQETRGWNEDTGKTSSQRSKEDAQDYRYMPDADIPPIILDDALIESVQQNMPKMPAEYRIDWQGLGLDKSVVNSVLANSAFAELVSAVLSAGGPSAAKRIANLIASNLDSVNMNDDSKLASTESFCELAEMIESSAVSSNSAVTLFNRLMIGEESPKELAEKMGILQNSDEEAIIAIVDSVIKDESSQKAVADIRAGNDRAIGFLVGQVMKRSNGQANPSVAQKIINERIKL